MENITVWKELGQREFRVVLQLCASFFKVIIFPHSDILWYVKLKCYRTLILHNHRPFIFQDYGPQFSLNEFLPGLFLKLFHFDIPPLLHTGAIISGTANTDLEINKATKILHNCLFSLLPISLTLNCQSLIVYFLL